MLSTLLTTINSLRDFLSRTFFLSAFLPTLVFVFTNLAILYVWSWHFHNWVGEQLDGTSTMYKTVLFSASFFAVWVHSYVVAALTPLWTRTLEGRNWWPWIREPGRHYHSARYREISDRINDAVQIYAGIDRKRPDWHTAIENAKSASSTALTGAVLSPNTQDRLVNLKKLQNSHQLISLSDLENLVETYEKEILANGPIPLLDSLAAQITLLIAYAHSRALSEHSRLLNERNMDFGDQEEIAPTQFGNVGLSAQAYAMRAYRCNIGRIWNSVRRVIEKE